MIASCNPAFVKVPEEMSCDLLKTNTLPSYCQLLQIVIKSQRFPKEQ
jgi:hypothetical protein